VNYVGLAKWEVALEDDFRTPEISQILADLPHFTFDVSL
jgi:hypothetical protein